MMHGSRVTVTGLVTLALITGVLVYLKSDNPVSLSSELAPATSTKGIVVQRLSTVSRADEGTEIVHGCNSDSQGVRQTEDVDKLSQTESQLLPVLRPETIDNVEKFVFFVGYQRSGHSIIGSMMDAHPNMIIAHEFMLFKKLTQDPDFACKLQNKATLFNTLYQKSIQDAADGWHSRTRKSGKGYSLYIGTPWHGGKYNGTLKVIGDKSGGKTTITYTENKENFAAKLAQLQQTVNMPIRVIHVVRNPYDSIATNTLYETKISTELPYDLYRRLVAGMVNKTSLQGEYKEAVTMKLRHQAPYILKLAGGVDEMIRTLNLTALTIHSEDFVRDPKETISRICAFLDVPCPKRYLQACYNKAYKTSSKSRNLIAWPEDVLAYVQTEMGAIPFLRRYTFEGE